MLGKKMGEHLAAYRNSLIFFGAGWFVTLVYFTDWRAVAWYIPFYNGKFKGEKPKSDKC